MNLFIVDADPLGAARQNNDFHVRKIILEGYEMMAYTLLKNNIELEYWPHLTLNHRHVKHPMTKAVMSGKDNFQWCAQYAYGLCEEFQYRFGKEHKTKTNIVWAASKFKDLKFEAEKVDWPRCFGHYKDRITITNDIVNDYRQYYRVGKQHLAHWTNREEPWWWKVE